VACAQAQDAERASRFSAQLVPSGAESAQYEPIYAVWKFRSRDAEAAQVETPSTLEIELWKDGGWISPYSLPERDRGLRAGAVCRPPEGRDVGPRKVLAGELEFVDVAVVAWPGRYRARVDFRVSAASREGVDRRHEPPAWFGLVRSPWVTFEVVPHAGNEARLGEARRTRDAQWRRYRTVLYSGGFESVWLSHGKPPELDALIDPRKPAAELIALGLSDPILAKAHLVLANDAILRGVYAKGRAARRHFTTALGHLDDVSLPTDRIARAHLAPTVALLRLRCRVGQGHTDGAARALEKIRKAHPAYFAARPSLLRGLEAAVAAR
jgi:hypothetical protein